MGTAQQILQPRNRGYMSQVMNDTLSVVEDEFRMCFGQLTVTSNESQRTIRFPFPIVVERYWFTIVANNLDALSVNALVLRRNGVSQNSMPILSGGANVNFDSGRINVPYTNQIDGLSFQWESDSVGTTVMRNLAVLWRATGLG